MVGTLNRKEIFKIILMENIERDFPKGIEREYNIPLMVKNKVISIIGPRRSGKTFLMFQLMERLSKEIPRDRILYINLEDDRILPLKKGDLSLILEAYYELFPENINNEVYLFLDEVQNAPNWEAFVRRALDSGLRVFVTGSSSKMLSKEIATSLRGRGLTFEIQVFSFREFLRAKKRNHENIAYSTERFKIKALFEEYLKWGGFPEITFIDDGFLKLRTLQEYFEVMFYKDIVERYGVKKFQALRHLVKFLASNVSRYFSASRYYKFARQEMKVRKEDILNFLSYIEDVKMFFFLPKFSYSIRAQLRNPRKVYCVDTGLRNANSFLVSEDYGYLAENIVFLELRSRMLRNPKIELYYWKDSKEHVEVDFVVKEGKDVKELIQVSWEIERSIDREVKAMLKALKLFNLKEGLILTKDYEETKQINGRRIIFKPIWKWLIS